MLDNFSKYELYSTVNSIYCYPNTNILKNKFNIIDGDILKQIESETTYLKLEQLMGMNIIGRFSVTHLKNIHKYLFSDIYSFAGKYRKEQIGKANTWFYPPNAISATIHKLITELKKEHYLKDKQYDDFINRLAYYMAELNAVHPFREGNGRTIREFIRQLALYNQYELDWSLCDKMQVLEASILSYDDYTTLIPIISKCLNILK